MPSWNMCGAESYKLPRLSQRYANPKMISPNRIYSVSENGGNESHGQAFLNGSTWCVLILIANPFSTSGMSGITHLGCLKTFRSLLKTHLFKDWRLCSTFESPEIYGVYINAA